MAAQLAQRVKDFQGTEFMVSPDGRITLVSTGRVWRPGDASYAVVLANLAAVPGNAPILQSTMGHNTFATELAKGQAQDQGQSFAPQLPAVIPPADVPEAASAGLPSWALPVGILAVGVIVAGGIFYFSRKKS